MTNPGPTPAPPARLELGDRLSGEEHGPDAEAHLSAIAEFAKAGFGQVFVHQIGPGQAGFFDFYRREILPVLRGA